MMTQEEITKEMKGLVDKWKGRKDPPYMSKEYIDRRFDRIRYSKLRAKLNILKAKKRTKENSDELFEFAKKIFSE